MTVPPAEALRLFNRILCSLDFSEASLRALDYVFLLAKEADADVLLMHVLEHVPDPEGWLRAPVVTEQLRAGEQDVRKRLRAVVPDDARRWCRPDALVARGKPYREILHVASERC